MKNSVRIKSFVQNDIPKIVAESKQTSDRIAGQKPMYADIGCFVSGVMKDAKFLFPNIESNQDVLRHVMKTFCTQEK